MPDRTVAGTKTSSTPLAGLEVLVTRPAQQAEAFCRMLTSAGALVNRFPVLEIIAPPQAVSLVALPLETIHLVIFVSVNAVHWGLKQGPPAQSWPSATQIAAIGRSTAAALEEYGLPVDLVPGSGFTSEDLLALDVFQQVAGKRVLIVRGVGGRETLADTLRARGAEVLYAQVYARALPQQDSAPLLRRWEQGGIQVVTVTSGESLRNLWELLAPAGQVLLCQSALVVASERIAEQARSLGCQGTIAVADDATDAAMFTTLLHLAQAGHAGLTYNQMGANKETKHD